MFLNSSVSLLPILGAVGVGVVTPIIYKGGKRSNFQTYRKRKLENSTYLLGSCKKQLNIKEYVLRLFLSEDVEGGDDNDRGLGLTLYVTANNGEKLFGGWSLKGGDSSDNVAQLSISPQTISTELSERQSYWDDLQDCPIENIIAPQNSSSHEVPNYDIKFVCQEKNYESGEKDCDVKFSQENKFTFKRGFTPKLKLWTF